MPDFVVKDSGVREEYSTGMRRDTQEGKAKFSLVTPVFLPYEEQMLTRWAMLMTNGAKKYGERNWEKAHTPEELKRFRDSAFRHFMQWFTSADQDEDHAAATMFNIACAEYVDYFLRHPDARHPSNVELGPENDFADRPEVDEAPGQLELGS